MMFDCNKNIKSLVCKFELYNQPASWKMFEVSCRSLFPRGVCTEFLTSHTKPRLVVRNFCCQLRTAVVRGQPLVKLYIHVQDVFVNFVVKLLIVSEVVFSIIKLAQDALRELVEINSCEYEYLVATHLIVFFRTNLS